MFTMFMPTAVPVDLPSLPEPGRTSGQVPVIFGGKVVASE